MVHLNKLIYICGAGDVKTSRQFGVKNELFEKGCKQTDESNHRYLFSGPKKRMIDS